MDLTPAIAELRRVAAQSGDLELVRQCEDALAGDRAARERIVVAFTAEQAAGLLGRVWPVCPRCLAVTVGDELTQLISASTIADGGERRAMLGRFGLHSEACESSTVIALALGWAVGALTRVADEPYLFCAAHALVSPRVIANDHAEGDHT